MRRDLTGNYDTVELLGPTSQRSPSGKTIYNALCLRCGKEFTVVGSSVVSRRTRSCGCLQAEVLLQTNADKAYDLIGVPFGLLTPIRKTGRRRHGSHEYECVCECGGSRVVSTTGLTQEGIICCGCTYGRPGRKVTHKPKADYPAALTARQMEIVNGSLLGDGSLKKPVGKNGDSSFSKRQVFRESIEWIRAELVPYSLDEVGVVTAKTKPVINKKTGKIKHVPCEPYVTGYATYTAAHPVFSVLRDKWYSVKKVVPRDLVLTPLTLAVWHIDDGYNNLAGRQVILATNGFSHEDVSFLRRRLFEDFGLITHDSPGDNDQLRIGIYGDSYDRFMSVISPFASLWSCFSKKFVWRERKRKQWRSLNEAEKVKIFELATKGLSQSKIANEIETCRGHIQYVLRSKALKSSQS